MKNKYEMINAEKESACENYEHSTQGAMKLTCPPLIMLVFHKAMYFFFVKKVYFKGWQHNLKPMVVIHFSIQYFSMTKLLLLSFLTNHGSKKSIVMWHSIITFALKGEREIIKMRTHANRRGWGG